MEKKMSIKSQNEQNVNGTEHKSLQKHKHSLDIYKM